MLRTLFLGGSPLPTLRGVFREEEDEYEDDRDKQGG